MKPGSTIKKGGLDGSSQTTPIANPWGQEPTEMAVLDGMEVFTIKTPTECPYDFSDRPEVFQLALQFNWAYNQGGDVDRAFQALYNYVITHTGVVLRELSPDDCFCVGMAFATIALEIETVDGQRSVNSVASENSFYCLMKYFKGTDDKIVIPTLFSLLYGPEDLLGDALTNCHLRQFKNAPSHGAFLGKWYDFDSPEFRRSAISYRLAMCMVLMDQVYDWDTRNYTINSLGRPHACWPSREQLSQFYDEFIESPFIAMNYEVPGNKYLDGVFEECERILKMN